MPSHRTQVAIIGSGPSGLTLAQLLDGARLEREGLKHHGVEIAAGEQRYRIDFAAQNASLTVYGQTELTKDLMEARDASGVPPIFKVEDVVLENIEGER